MERKFSNELIEAIQKCVSDRGILIVSETTMGASAFWKAEAKNKLRAHTVYYILPDGTVLEKMSEKKRQELSEFAAIIDMEGEFYFVAYMYKD